MSFPDFPSDSLARSSFILRTAISSLSVIGTLLSPILPSYITPLVQPYSPRTISYSPSPPIAPLLLGPVNIAQTPLVFCSRLVQSNLIYNSPSPSDTAFWAWLFWLFLASARIGTGYLFTRSVVRAMPRLFSHDALYEQVGGLGAGLLAVIAWRGLTAEEKSFECRHGRLAPRRIGVGEEVMSLLEGRRLGSEKITSGCPGTGGSGLMMHHTMLPLLPHLLHAYSLPILPPHLQNGRLQPDEVFQQCLLGRHTDCTRHRTRLARESGNVSLMNLYRSLDP